jgi:hypothetical protein
MHATPNSAQMPTAADLIESWLARQVTLLSSSQSRRDTFPRLPPQTGPERLASVREVLNRQPSIARYARRLSVHDQLRLTIEMLGGIISPTRVLADRFVAPGRSGQVAIDPARRSKLCLRHPHRYSRSHFSR